MKRTFADYEDKRKVSSWSDENEGSPEDYGLYSNKKFKFICFECNHEIYMVLNTISKGSWCIYCAGYKICTNNDCVICYEKSYEFHYPEESLEWSPKNVLLPSQVMKSSDQTIYFDCHKCGHEYSTKLYNRSMLGKKCPYCTNQKICPEKENCDTCFRKSFASYDKDKVVSWSSKNDMKPCEYLIGSNKKILFDCDKCGHEFIKQISKITQRQSWCPYCANQKMCGTLDCKVCFKKSFANFDQEKVSCFSSKNVLRPHQLFLSTKRSFYFDCKTCGKEFYSKLNNITSSQRSWCPHCKTNKNMATLIKALGKYDGIKFKQEVTVLCEGRRLRWDVVVSTRHGEFCIESDGPHHFTIEGVISVANRKKENAEYRFIDQRKRDLLKEKNIIDNKGLLFRFSYRQNQQIDALVEKMFQEHENGTVGVVYMDSLYINWVPIKE